MSALPYPPMFLTVHEVADMCRLSERAVYRAVESGELPGTKLRSRLRIRASDVEKWIEQGLVGQYGDAGGHAPVAARTREEQSADFRSLIETETSFTSWKSGNA